MNRSPPYADILEDDALAPLKRNHACLQCKKRKVKCDAIKPTCSPCLRSHAHALRSAQRNKSNPTPVLCCTYAEGEDEAERDSSVEVFEVREVTESRRVSGSGNGSVDGKKTNERKKGGISGSLGKKLGSGDKALLREKERRKDEEKDILMARIAQLEARLANLTPASVVNDPSPASTNLSNPSIPTSSSGAEFFNQPGPSQTWVPDQSTAQIFSVTNFEAGPSTTLPINGGMGLDGLAFDSNPAAGLGANWDSTVPDVTMDQDWDFGGLFVVPLNWPKNLPAPILLEHLVETFFESVPQMPRILHRTTLLARIKLPPTNPRFPHPALLHAICAAAASHTAWVNSLPPDQVEIARLHAVATGMDLESMEDFGSAQAESASRSIHQSAAGCVMGPGTMIFEITQAALILVEVYFTKGLALLGWIVAGIPPRLIASMELGKRNIVKGPKPGLLPEPATDVEREERLATLWMAFVVDAGFSINSSWAQSMNLEDLRCALPTSIEEFSKVEGFMKQNPQTAHDEDFLTHHPIDDSFILTVKSTILLTRVVKWIRKWQQRIIVEGDEYDGLHSNDFIALNTEIFSFQLSVPPSLRNLFRILDTGNSADFSSNLLSLHILPHICTIILHEPFIEWDQGPNASVHHVERACQSVLGLLHLIPSSKDVSLIITPVICFSLYTIGRLLVVYSKRAVVREEWALAMKHRTDLMLLNAVLRRYGQKNALGNLMSEFLTEYLRGSEPHETETNRRRITYEDHMKSKRSVCPGDTREIATDGREIGSDGRKYVRGESNLPATTTISGSASTSGSGSGIGTSPDCPGSLSVSASTSVSASGCGSSTKTTPESMEPSFFSDSEYVTFLGNVSHHDVAGYMTSEGVQYGKTRDDLVVPSGSGDGDGALGDQIINGEWDFSFEQVMKEMPV